jgi:membrane associated rhomboid family serine protease
MVSVRRAVIFVAQILALLFIVVSTMAGAMAGQDWLSNALPSLSGVFASLPGPGVSIFGAIFGFFVSTILVAIFFLAVEIANNTRNPFNT